MTTLVTAKRLNIYHRALRTYRAMHHVEVVSDREHLDVDVSKESRLEAEVLDPGDRTGEQAGVMYGGLETPGGKKGQPSIISCTYICVCVCVCMCVLRLSEREPRLSQVYAC